jgi:leucyl-tRNA synthetase/phosphoserine phosphatase
MKKLASTGKQPAAYDHKAIEKKWQKYWESKKSYQVKEDSKKKKFYALIEFPYPSGDGLHVGHPRPYIGMDVVARKRRAEGYNVLYPIGWDAFGLPTENYAIKTGTPPAIVTKQNTATFTRQIKSLGISFDWSREIYTTDPAYYKWTQWIFLQFFKKGLAYKKKMIINWCPKDLIGLANEEVIDGKCERCGTLVEKREKEQWMLAITKYAEKLLAGLDARVTPNGTLVEDNSGVPLFTQLTESSAIRPELAYSERNAILAIVKHWSEDKYIGLKWKKVAWKTLITGGPEGDQTPEQVAVREIIEETGYKSLKLIKHLDPMDAKFFHVPKNINRYAHFDVMYFELQNGDRNQITLEEQGNHEVVWLSKQEMSAFLTPASQQYVWEKFLNPKFDISRCGQPLLNWKEAIKEQQRNWIGKSEGAELTFKIKSAQHANAEIKVFTTRPDTLFGVTYVVLAPEHALVKELLANVQNKSEVEAYIAKVKKETDIERTDASKEKTGVELKGIQAINPANKEEVPVWIADYVLADYGTGAVMAVPAHDERDGEFAKKYGLPIKEVVAPLINVTSGEFAFKPGIKTVERECILAIVKHWEKDEYLCLTSPKHGWTAFVIGGIDAGEAALEAAKREITEETGFTDFGKITQLGGHIHAKHFAPHKNENRAATLTGFYIELKSGAQHTVSEHEANHQQIVWVPKKEIPSTLHPKITDWAFWQRFVTGHAPFVGDGILENSGAFTGKDSIAAKKEITSSVGGKWITTFKLRDWIFSRQRYWGEPIPVVHCPVHGAVPVPEKDLPVKLPPVKNYKPTETGESPLAAISKWVNTKCPQCVADRKKPKYFVFDFDGVLGDTWASALKAYIGMEGVTTEDEAGKRLKAYFSKKPHHTRDSARSPEQVMRDTNWSKEFGQKMQVIGFPLFTQFIKEIKKYPHARIAAVSSGSEIYVKPALKKTGIAFSHILAFENNHSKEEKIESIAKDWGVSLKDIYYFTDTKGDVYELENLLDRSKIVGCAWGYQGYEGLAELLPERQILKDFDDIHRFFNVDCSAKRETDTMPNWAGSSWYYLRYADPKNKKAFADPKNLNYWTPVDWYNGGMEHTTLHLLYSRFWHKFLFDLGLVPTNEPYLKRTSHGLILAEGGVKMSKSKGNVINPDGIVETVGADSLRLYEMFMGPFDQPIAWDTNNIAGVRRFIERVWKLREKVTPKTAEKVGDFILINKIIHKAVKKVSDDIEGMRFNTAISALMISLNELEKSEAIDAEQYGIFLQLLAPFAPHVAEELWASLGNKNFIHTAPWPSYDATLAADTEATIIVQVNGKVRGSFVVPTDTSTQELEKMARQIPEAAKWLEGKEVKKVIVIPNKLVNMVVV